MALEPGAEVAMLSHPLWIPAVLSRALRPRLLSLGTYAILARWIAAWHVSGTRCQKHPRPHSSCQKCLQPLLTWWKKMGPEEVRRRETIRKPPQFLIHRYQLVGCRGGPAAQIACSLATGSESVLGTHDRQLTVASKFSSRGSDTLV